MTLTLDDLRTRPRVVRPVTQGCSGSHGFLGFTGAIGNPCWKGAALTPLLEEADLLREGIEVVAWGTDQGTVERHDAVRDASMQHRFA